MTPAHLYDDVVFDLFAKRVRDARVMQVQVHALGGQRFRLRLYIHSTKNFPGRARRVGSTTDLETISPTDDIDAESALQLFQVLIEWTANVCQSFIVRRLQPYIVDGGEIWLGLSAQLKQENSSDGDWRWGKINKLAAKAVRQRLGDAYMRKLADEIMIPGKIDDTIVFRSPGKLPRVLF